MSVLGQPGRGCRLGNWRANLEEVPLPRRCVMFVALIISVPIVLLLVWAVVFDFKQRRRNEPLTNHDARSIAARQRNEAEGKGSEWGAGGF